MTSSWTRNAALIVVALPVLAIVAWIVNALIGMRAAAQTAGTLRAPGLTASAQIIRDARGIPHIRASNDHDLFFAQGYAEASDRLFQMDLLRRFVYGRLAEIIGSAALRADEQARIVDIRGIARAQWSHVNAHDRALLQAFSDGVNVAMQQQPAPVEFHLLVYRPQPWNPQDSLAVGMATALDLIDPWDDVIRRDAVARAHSAAKEQDLYSITDPAYDAPITSRTVAPIARLSSKNGLARATFNLPDREPVGSNEWAVGALHSTTGRALLANDPHLRLQIPGVWYLVDLRSGELHVAGGSLAGTPGVILGHNDNIAWSATNGTVVTEVVYRDAATHMKMRNETFHVRFGRDVTVSYYGTKHGFVVQHRGTTAYAVDWNAARDPLTALLTFEGLDRARSISDALKALHNYPGPPQNFVIADRSGSVAYQLAGLIPDDPLWGLRVHAGSDPLYPFIPFDALPHVNASRSGIVFTANNRMYGAGYPYRLSAFFEPPYRAKRIEQLLSTKPRFSVADFARFQTDTLSLAEQELARETLAAVARKGVQDDPALQPYVQALSAWNGRFDPDSRGAPIIREVARTASESLAVFNSGSAHDIYTASERPNITVNMQLVVLMRVLRERPNGWWPRNDYDDLLVRSLRTAIRSYGSRLLEPWGQYAPIPIRHPLAPLGFSFLNGVTLPGDGDNYGLHVQNSRDSQSFRAVWDVGNWDDGGIVIPSGESGEPASGHYTDQSAMWMAQRMVPLPFSDAAVRASTKQTLTLTP